MTWTYRDRDGRPVAFQNRFDPPNNGRKVFSPQVWTKANGWQWKAPPEPRPLYGLDRLASQPEAPALICEGEKSADAAARLLPELAAVATMNGAQSPAKSDLSPLNGRRVRIWPDHDEPGAAFARKVADLARQAGAASVEVLDLSSLARDPKTGEPRELPEKWDAANAEADGWTPETLAAAVRWIPFAPPETPKQPAPKGSEGAALPFGFELRANGIYCQRPGNAKDKTTEGDKGGNGSGSGGDGKQWVYVCPPLKVLAVTRDERGVGFGRLAEFEDLDGRTRREMIGDRERSGSGDTLRARLADMGFELSTHPEARRQFLELLRRWVPEKRARSVTQTGWTPEGGAFVLPDRVLGEGPEPVILAAEGERPAFGTRGTLDDWRGSVGAFCRGNSRLTFCVSMAFAAPLLRLCGAESGGFHLRGSSTDASSSGKTTVQRVACSVCGSPSFLESCRTTDNAAETQAELHNDSLLILDELVLMEARVVGDWVYMVGNEKGKSRMGRDAGARPVKTWRLLFLTSGEIGLEEHMASAGKRRRGGQETRLAEISADAGKGLGIFENLHGFENGALFATALTDAAALSYGTPLIAFVEALIRHRAELPATIKKLQHQFVTEVLTGIENPAGQVRRVAARFGLVAVGGELATSEGITGWEPGEAIQAAARCFKDWMAARGGSVPAEERDLLSQVRYFFEAHANRFRWKDRVLDDHAPEVPHQAGFKDTPHGKENGIVYLAFPETFKREICEGYDAKDAARVLVRHGILKPSGDKRPSRNERLPGYKNPQRVFVFAFDGEGGE
jgi:uncharacterized protein (DUF927 family)